MLAAAAPTAVVADGRAGRLARIETTAPSRSWIAPGRFVMGTRPDDLELLQAECELTRSDSLARALAPPVRTWVFSVLMDVSCWVFLVSASMTRWRSVLPPPVMTWVSRSRTR